jgi:hypothetical protein
MKNEEINQQEEIEKKEWNAPQINELGVDKTESGKYHHINESNPIYHNIS